MLPGSTPGSNENAPTCSRLAPVCSRRNSRRCGRHIGRVIVFRVARDARGGQCSMYMPDQRRARCPSLVRPRAPNIAVARLTSAACVSRGPVQRRESRRRGRTFIGRDEMTQNAAIGLMPDEAQTDTTAVPEPELVVGEAKPDERCGARLYDRAVPAAADFAFGSLIYLTNHVVAHVPSFTLRHLWYRRVLGIQLGQNAGMHMGTYVWFFGPREIRRFGVRIGRNTRIGRDCTIDARSRLTIGDNVALSPEVMILAGTHDVNDPEFADSAVGPWAVDDRGLRVDRDARDDHARRDPGARGRRRGWLGRHEGCSAADDRGGRSRQADRYAGPGRDRVRTRLPAPAVRVIADRPSPVNGSRMRSDSRLETWPRR